MKNRRAFLLAAGAAAVPAAALAARKDTASGASRRGPRVFPYRNPGPSACYFPNVAVVDQFGREHRLYDDLIQDRILAINFMSVDGDQRYPVTDNLVQVQKLLPAGARRRLQWLSITLDAERDTPERLLEFARTKGAGENWLFLTGDPEDLAVLHANIFVHRPTPLSPSANHPRNAFSVPGCSVGLGRYGNEALGRWGSFPLRIAPESIAERFSWVGLDGRA